MIQDKTARLYFYNRAVFTCSTAGAPRGVVLGLIGFREDTILPFFILSFRVDQASFCVSKQDIRQGLSQGVRKRRTAKGLSR